MKYHHILYEVDGNIARITLNRPKCLNAINAGLGRELQDAVARANADEDVHVIILSGSGKGFCSGWDLKEYAEKPGYNPGFQKHPWDPTIDFKMMKANTDAFMSFWRSYKPTICQLHGCAVGGGSDLALCCDIVVMAENATIGMAELTSQFICLGYPPARVWGCPTTAMWVYRIGAEKAKRMLLTGDVINGIEAKALGLVTVYTYDMDNGLMVDRMLSLLRS